jgi:3-hydroxybutyryl-CoA dehydrogenase
MGNQEITKVGVVGCGLMGAGIAEICARAGRDVVVVELDDRALAAGRARIEASVQRAADRGKMEPSQAEAALGCLTYSTDATALADRQLVVEAVV